MRGLHLLASDVEAAKLAKPAAARDIHFALALQRGRPSSAPAKGAPAVAAASKPTPAQEAAEKTLRQQLGIARGDSLGSHPLHSAAANGNLKACLALIEALRPAPEAAADVSADARFLLEPRNALFQRHRVRQPHHKVVRAPPSEHERGRHLALFLHWVLRTRWNGLSLREKGEIRGKRGAKTT